MTDEEIKELMARRQQVYRHVCDLLVELEEIDKQLREESYKLCVTKHKRC